MLRSTTKYYWAALIAVSATVSLASRPVFAQAEPADGDMEDVEIVINMPDMGPPDDGEMSIALGGGMPPGPGMDVGAMRRGGPGGFGHGGPGGPGGRHGGPCPLMMLSGDNAVTDEQYEKLYDLKNRTLDQVGPKMLDLHTAERHLRDVLTQETIDEKAAKKLQSQITSLKADLEGIKLDGKMSMMQILTGAQRKELRQAMIKGPMGRMGRCGPPGGPGGPGGHHKFMEKKSEN